MADQGEHGISWTDTTWNPVRGCSRVSEGCRFCYAERVAARFSGPGQPYDGLAKNTPAGPRWTGKVRLVPEHLDDPLRWRRPRRVFVNSMSDLFHESLPDSAIDAVFAVMALTPEHVFQVLTKRPERMLAYCSRLADREVPVSLAITRTPWWNGPHGSPCATGAIEDRIGAGPLPNVWLGVSVEDQATADERITLLLQTPAAVRWVSYEPALGPVDFGFPGVLAPTKPAGFDEWPEKRQEDAVEATARAAYMARTETLDWIVAGGESGPGARPSHPDWYRAVRDQCVAAGAAFHFKQHGEWCDYSQAGLGGWEFTAERNGARYGRLFNSEGPGFALGGREVETRYPWQSEQDPGPCMVRIGKRAAGRLLDGREWNEFPVAA